MASASDTRNLELLTTLQLVLFLSSTSNKSDFDKVSFILSSREETMRARCRALESKNSFLMARCGEMKEKRKRVYDRFRTKIDDLELMVSEEEVRCALLKSRCGELHIEMLEAREEADRYRMENEEMKEKMKWVKEEALVMRVKEQRGRERITGLLNEIESMEKELEESFVGCGKKQAQDEADAWMQMHKETEAFCLDLAKQNRGLIEKMEKQQSNNRSTSRANDDSRNPCETRHREKPLFQRIIVIGDDESDAEAPCVKSKPISNGSAKKMHTQNDEDYLIPIGWRLKMKRHFEAIEESNDLLDTATSSLRPCKRVKDEVNVEKF